MHSTRSKPKQKAEPNKNLQFSFEAIGTHWTIDIHERIKRDMAAKLFAAIQERIEEFDKNYSRFRNDSLISQMAQKSGTYKLPDDAKHLLDFYEEMYLVTNGAVTPLIGQALSDTGYDSEYTLKSKTVITQTLSWQEVIDYDYPMVTLKHPALLDLGAAGKGRLVDLVGELLQSSGFKSFCVDAGGDMLHKNEEGQKLQVGLENPENNSQVIGVVDLGNQALCGSAGNRRTWGKFHHILDPKSHQSPRQIKAVWVAAETAMLADGLTTCLFFVPASKLLKRYTFSYALVAKDNSLVYSPDFPARFF